MWPKPISALWQSIRRSILQSTLFRHRTFHGQVVQVRNAPITVQNVVTYDTVIGVTNAELKLKPGMTANVSIVVAHRDNVLQIKNAALRFRPPEATPGCEAPIGRGQGGDSRRAGRRRAGAAQRTDCLSFAQAVVASRSPCRSRPASAMGSSTEVLEGLKEGDGGHRQRSAERCADPGTVPIRFSGRAAAVLRILTAACRT